MLRSSFILLLILLSPASYGQSESLVLEPSNSIQIGFGAVHSRLIDEGYSSSKLLFRGTNSKFSVGYKREEYRYILGCQVSASSGELKSRSGNLPSDFISVQPSIEYLRNIRSLKVFGNEFLVFAGLSLNSANYVLQNEPVFDNAEVFSLHGIYLRLNGRYRLRYGQRLNIGYSIPAAVFINRALWNGGASTLNYKDGENLIQLLTTHGRMSYFSIIDNIQLNVDYSRPISNKFDFTVKYKFFFAGNSRPAPFHMYTNEVLIGLKFKFF